MQSTNTENEEQQGSPEHMEHQWHMENDSNIVSRNNFITRYIVMFKGINKPYRIQYCNHRFGSYYPGIVSNNVLVDIILL